MESLSSLSRQQQRIRLRQLARKSLLEFGIENAKLSFISDTTNTIFRVQTDRARFALRIDPEPPTDDRSIYLEEELMWLERLNKDTTLLVPNPVVSNSGSPVQLVTTPLVPEGKLITLLHWMTGKLVGERVSQNVMWQLGEIAAILHRHTQEFCLPDGSVRTHINWEQKLKFILDRKLDLSPTLTNAQRDLCISVIKPLIADISSISKKENYGLIHCDLHQYNCLLYKKNLLLIDFHDCCLGSYFYDLAVPLSYLDEYSNYDKLKNSFLDGYKSLRSLPNNYLRYIDIYRVARAFDIIEWLYYYWPDLENFPEGRENLNSAIRRIKGYESDLH